MKDTRKRKNPFDEVSKEHSSNIGSTEIPSTNGRQGKPIEGKDLGYQGSQKLLQNFLKSSTRIPREKQTLAWGVEYSKTVP